MDKNDKKVWIKIRKIIDDLAKKHDKVWRQRIRKSGGINSKFLINFIFQLTLNSKKGYGIILSELWDDYLSKNITTPQKNTYAISSICEARQKFPEYIFKELNKNILEIFEKESNYLYMDKHRVFAIDGSKVSLEKNLEKDGYKIFNTGAYYPTGLLSCLYDVNTNVVHDFSITKNMGERESALKHIETLKETDIIILDRGYFSYLLLRKITDKKAHVLFRLQGNVRNKAIKNFLNSNKEDGIISYKPSKTVQHDLKKRGHEIDFSPILFRVLKQKIEGQDYVFGTTLIGGEYKKEIFYDLYHSRWDIEELYKISKEIFNIEDMHAKTERGAKQEIYAQFILINIARFLEIKGSVEQGLDRKKEKINFKGCIAGIGKYINEIMFKGYSCMLAIIERMLKFISKMRYKIRPNRKFLRISYKPHKRWRLPYGTLLAA